MKRDEITDETIAEAVRLKKRGATTRTISKSLGLGADTLGRWCAAPVTEKQMELARELEKADAEYQLIMLGVIASVATGLSISGKAGKTWQAAAWILERRWPQEFGRSVRYVGNGAEGSEGNKSFAETATERLKLLKGSGKAQAR